MQIVDAGRFCCVFVLACVADIVVFPATAQQPQLYQDRVDAHWFHGNSRFWYRRNLREGRSEFVTVDTATATRAASFDHEKVSIEMSRILKRPVSASALPVESLSFAESADVVTLSGSAGEWKLTLPDHTLTLLNQKSTQTPLSLFLPTRRSEDKGGDTEISVINDLTEEVELVWIDRAGGSVTYGSLRPGQKRDQHTFAGHVWLLQLKSGSRIGAFEATDRPMEVRINETLQKSVRTMAEPQRDRSMRRSPGPDGISPDGQWQALVRNHNLILTPTDGMDPIPLSTDASQQDTFHFDSTRARALEMRYALSDAPEDKADVRWSPTSEHLMAFQTRTVVERRVHYVESSPADQLQPRLHSYPYAKPGDDIPIRRPRLFTREGAEIPVANDLFPNPWKLTFQKWSDDGSRFYLLYNQRGHQCLRVLEVTASNGHVRAVVDEQSETFIQYSDPGKHVLEWLPEDELLWASERSGWNHLYRYSLEQPSSCVAVTSGNWNVRRIEDIDRNRRQIYFFAVGVHADQDPYHEHFCRVNMDGTGFQVLTEGDGTHQITWSPNRDFFVDRYSRVDLPPVNELRRSNDGTLVCHLESADASEVTAAFGEFPERFVAKGRDGITDIWGIIHRPRHFDPEVQYPVVENIYAGPHDHHVPKSFRTRYRHQRQIADRGHIVVQIDGMGTAWRSKSFHDVCYRNLRDAGFPDRIAWIRAAAAEHPEFDVSRVGIYGGSAGGQNAMAALLWHGTFYKVAVADCGCHDNRMDKIWWNEQWMGWPVDHSYVQNSNVENAWRLQGHLMLVVGELDRNVDPASTIQVVQKLIAANKNFDFVFVPGAGHGACETPWAARRRADFLAIHLNSPSHSDVVKAE